MGSQSLAVEHYRDARKMQQAPASTAAHASKPDPTEIIRCARHLQQVCNKLHLQKKELKERVR